MIKYSIIDIYVVFDKKKITQKNILSPFLFNIYMNKFDFFIVNLIRKKSVSFLKNDIYKFKNKQKSKKIKTEFNNVCIYTALKKYGSIKNIKNELKFQLKSYYTSYKNYYKTNIETRNIFYTRYGDNLVLGIVGSKLFAIEVQFIIYDFLKSNLHLDASKYQLINENNRKIKFLGYIIYLSTFSKSSKILSNKIQAIKKSKKKVLARFRQSDKRLAKAAFLTARSSLLSAYKTLLNNSSKKLSKTNFNKISQLLVTSLNYQDNPTLKRWIQSFKSKATKELFFASKFYIENLQSLPDSDKLNNSILSKITLAKNKFLNNLNSIYFKEFEEIKTKRCKKMLEIKSKINISKFKTKISLIEAVQLANISKKLFFKKTQFRNVKILAPTNKLFNDLRAKGFFHQKKNQPCGNTFLVKNSDIKIIKVYSAIIFGLLSYYRVTDNFNKVKSIVMHLRKGCLFTLTRKHNKSIA